MAGGQKIDKPCEVCGEMMHDVSPQRMFCVDCRKEMEKARRATEKVSAYNREYHKNYKRRKRKKSLDVPAPIYNPYQKFCKKCIYWGGHSESDACCNYIFRVGHSRGCPPGKGCTKMTPRVKRRFDGGLQIDSV
jgi:hypothetical protein